MPALPLQARTVAGGVIIIPATRDNDDDDEPLMEFSGVEVAPPYDPAPAYSPALFPAGHEHEHEQPPQYEAAPLVANPDEDVQYTVPEAPGVSTPT